MFLSGELYSTARTDQHGPQEQLTAKFRPGDVEIDNISSFFCNIFGANPPVCLGDTQKLDYTSPNHNLQVRCRQRDAHVFDGASN